MMATQERLISVGLAVFVERREREREPCDKTDLSILVLMSTVLRT